MTIREQIVASTLSFRGTPYVDRGMVKHCGVDCFTMPMMVFKEVGLLPKDFSPPRYSPQQWLNSPSQKDKFSLRVEDTTALDIVLKYCVREITEKEVLPGDLVIYKIVNSWTHGAIVINWPEHVIHSVKGLGVIGSHGTKEGMVRNLLHRFFTFVKDEQ
jgi:cell wall-associated NlpC family hydrolase